MKTAELIGAALDWAVAKCEGVYLAEPVPLDAGCVPFLPSINWAQAGPIIEREGIDLGKNGRLGSPTAYEASITNTIYYGPTPLIAAMRTYVASKLGDEVEIPEELK